MSLSFVCAALALSGAVPQKAEGTVEVLERKIHHLGDDQTPEWKDAAAEPDGVAVNVKFDAKVNQGEKLILFRHMHVNNEWWLWLNGKRLHRLQVAAGWVDAVVSLPPGSLKDGENKLGILPKSPRDDILVGDIRLVHASLRQHLKLRLLEVRVTDAGDQPVPAKITIVAGDGSLPVLFYAQAPHTAVRPGIVYTATGSARLEVPAGRYTVYASKGMEWGRAERKVDLRRQEAVNIGMRVVREVATEGYVASDTHIHTLTHSGHGDASMEERMITLAAEGVELAVATDHNHNIDYRPTQEAMGLHEHFTPVVGNEVTTKVGHVNAFPLDPKGKIPNHKLDDWVKLAGDIRGKGAKVLILNHPRWPKIATGPFGKYVMDRQTGEFADGRDFPFDAIEVINSGTLQPDPLFLFRDWFALLNHGHRVMAVGTSDSHTVGYPVGQGRTYVRSSSDHPGHIDIDEACRSFNEGTTSISLGMFAKARIGPHKMGATVSVERRAVEVVFHVAAPSWVKPKDAYVYLNGIPVATKRIPHKSGVPTNVDLSFTVRTPPHDAYLVCVALGEGVREKFWPTSEAYTCAASNPIWLDVDGDGQYTAPRAQARLILDRVGTEIPLLIRAMQPLDDSVAVALLGLSRKAFEAEVPGDPGTARAKLVRLAGGKRPSRNVFATYLESLPKLEKGSAPKGP